eukprot:8232320-Pyramimonas_sp.AAC.1
MRAKCTTVSALFSSDRQYISTIATVSPIVAHWLDVSVRLTESFICRRERDAERERERDREKERERERGTHRERERGTERERERERGTEGEREGQRERERDRGREGQSGGVRLGRLMEARACTMSAGLHLARDGDQMPTRDRGRGRHGEPVGAHSSA